MINENVSFGSWFRFKNVSENYIQQELLNVNSRNPGTLGNIPTDILKSSEESNCKHLRNFLTSW